MAISGVSVPVRFVDYLGRKPIWPKREVLVNYYRMTLVSQTKVALP